MASVPGTICDLSKDGANVIEIDINDTFSFEVKNLNSPKNHTCTWSINSTISKSSITFWKNILDLNDTLEIYDTVNPNKPILIFSNKGSITPGLLPIITMKIKVVLNLEQKPSIVDRVFNTVFYVKANQIEAHGFGGQFEFPKFLEEKNKSFQDYSFYFQPSESLSSEWKFVLSFDYLPLKYSFEIDGEQFSEDKNPLSKIFLPVNRSISFKLGTWAKTINNTVRFGYWPVISNCSKSINLTENPTPIGLPVANFRKERQLSMISCATIFNNINNKSIVVSFDVNSLPEHGLANVGDQITIAGIGKGFAGHDVITGKESLKSENYYYQAEQLFVSYDSFYSSEKTEIIKPPTVSYVSQGKHIRKY